jgi:tetraacyldisaccharide 4'-kinase
VSGVGTAYRRLLRGEILGPLGFLARLALSAASVPYGAAVRFRNWRYDRQAAPIARVERPVISVGNLTLGGTGKTPVVEWVARWYRRQGRRVCLLSRGYGQTDRLNDEGLVLDQNLPDVPHLQDRDRAALARIAIDELDADVLVLDDGFQHRRLARDLDLVLIDALDPFGGGRLFPRGLLREPVGSLARSSLVILSRADLVGPGRRAEIRQEAERRAGPLVWVESRQAPHSLVDAQGQELPVDELRGVRCGAFCGLGNPEGFRQTLLSLGVDLAEFRIYPDHHPYSRNDVERLARWADELRPALVLTTQKDSVKLRLDQIGGVRLLAVRIAFEPLSGVAGLESALADLLPGPVGAG